MTQLIADRGFRLRASRDPGAPLRSVCDRPRPGVRRGCAAQRLRRPDVSRQLVRDQRAHEEAAPRRMAVRNRTFDWHPDIGIRMGFDVLLWGLASVPTEVSSYCGSS